MQPALQKILTELGLTANEAAVYLAALSLGPSTILKIAKKVKPDVIMCGFSAYPRAIDFKKFNKPNKKRYFIANLFHHHT